MINDLLVGTYFRGTLADVVAQLSLCFGALLLWSLVLTTWLNECKARLSYCCQIICSFRLVPLATDRSLDKRHADLV